MRTLRIDCDTEGCAAYEVVAWDGPAHHPWICSVCQDRLDEQMAIDLEERHQRKIDDEWMRAQARIGLWPPLPRAVFQEESR